MMRRILLAACAAWAMSVALTGLSSGAQAERHVRVNPGVRLEDVIHATDSSVTIDVNGDPPLQVFPPPGTSMAQWMTQNATIIVLVAVDSIEGRLTSSGDDIESVVSGQIVDVLKGPGDSVGTRASFTVIGGSLAIKGVRVTAKRRWAKSFEAGSQYLVFGRPLPDGAVETWEGFVLHVSADGTWERMLVTDAPQVTQELKESDFLGEVRAAALDEK
jgi:hypothetical protein